MRFFRGRESGKKRGGERFKGNPGGEGPQSPGTRKKGEGGFVRKWRRRERVVLTTWCASIRQQKKKEMRGLADERTFTRRLNRVWGKGKGGRPRDLRGGAIGTLNRHQSAKKEFIQCPWRKGPDRMGVLEDGNMVCIGECPKKGNFFFGFATRERRGKNQSGEGV